MANEIVWLVDLTTGTVKRRIIPKTIVVKYLGGRGFNSKILYDHRHEIPKDPFDPSNIICVSSGLLSGTDFPSASRTTVSTLLSPVTRKFADGNLGGFFGPYMRYNGASVIVIRGASSRPCFLLIHKNSVRIVPITNDRDWTCGIYSFERLMERNFGRYTQTLGIGLGGVNKIFCAMVSSHKRTAGQGGLGAIFGSKMLKAIVVPAATKMKSRQVRESAAFNDLCQNAKDKIVNHPVYSTFRKYGTTALIELHAALNYLPSYNFTKTNFPNWRKVSGEQVYQHEKAIVMDPIAARKKSNDDQRGGCRNCPILCSGHCKVEYETLNCLGTKIGVDNLLWIIETNEDLFNDGGIDVIQTTSIISALMEMYEKGVSTYPMEWGNTTQVQDFVRSFLTGQDSERLTYGYLFSNGFKSGISALIHIGVVNKNYTTEYYYNKYYVHIKGNALSGVFPSNKAKGVALAIATASRGADHLRSLPTLATYADWYMKIGFWKKLIKLLRIPFKTMGVLKHETRFLVGNFYKNYTEVFGVPKYIVDVWKEKGFLFDESSYKGWESMIKFTQEMYAVTDAISMCRFVSPWRFGIGPDILAPAIQCIVSAPFDVERLLRVGERIYALERELLFHYEDTDTSDELPEKFYKKRFDKNHRGDIPIQKFRTMLSDYYQYCSYNHKGRPTARLLKRLSINDNEQIVKYGR